MNRDTSRILVVGAGYAGVTAANRLARRHDVTVVTDRPEFVERVRLHRLAAAGLPAVRDLRRMLDRRVRLVVDEVTDVRPGRVTTRAGGDLAADHVVLAVGSAAAGGVGSLDGARAVHAELARLSAGARVRVLGAGLTGLETATEIADRRPELAVELVDPAGLLPDVPERQRAVVAASLDRLGVDLRLGPSGERALEIDCTGLRVPAFLAASGLEVDALGRIRVASDLSVPGRDGLWAAGDCAAVEGRPWLRMSCAAATPMGAHVAESIDRRVAGLPTRPLDVGFVGRCVSLGSQDGVVLFVDRHDVPTGRVLTGRATAAVKEVLCRFAAVAPRVTRGRLWLGEAA